MKRTEGWSVWTMAAAMLASLCAMEAQADHVAAPETPSRVQSQVGDGSSAVNWTPRGTGTVSFTEYAVNDGPWQHSDDPAHCAPARLAECDPHAVEVVHPSPSNGWSYNLKLRSVLNDDGHGQRAYSEVFTRNGMRNGHASENEPPHLIEAQGWEGEYTEMDSEIELAIKVEPDTPIRTLLGGPFRLRDREGDAIWCEEEGLVSEVNGRPVAFTTGTEPVAGTAECQLLLNAGFEHK